MNLIKLNWFHVCYVFFKYIPRVVDIFKTHNHNEVIKCILNFNDFPLSLNGVGLFVWSTGFSFFFLFCVLLFFYFFYSLVVFLIHIKGLNRLYEVFDSFSVSVFIFFLSYSLIYFESHIWSIRFFSFFSFSALLFYFFYSIFPFSYKRIESSIWNIRFFPFSYFLFLFLLFCSFFKLFYYFFV